MANNYHEPLISIIIPAYNAEKYIIRALKSIKDQDFKDFEIIFINDGSSDNTLKLAKDFLTKTGLVHKVIDQQNSGTSVARNVGLENAKGKYILFMDADDSMDCTMLSKLYNKASITGAKMVFCGFKSINLDGEVVFRYKNKLSYIEGILEGKEVLHKYFNGEVAPSICSTLFSKEFIISKNLRFTAGCAKGEDREFYLKALFNCDKITCIREDLYNYYLTANSATRIASLSLFHSVGAKKRVIKYIKNIDSSSPFVNYLENSAIPGQYISIMAALCKFGFPAKKILALSRNERIRMEIKKFRPLKKDKAATHAKIEAFTLLYFPLLFYIYHKYFRKL